eukprot:1236444-Pleurochrysis_carterae.AAC.1
MMWNMYKERTLVRSEGGRPSFFSGSARGRYAARQVGRSILNLTIHKCSRRQQWAEKSKQDDSTDNQHEGTRRQRNARQKQSMNEPITSLIRLAY